jgi:DNA-binding XRE family transcriptional regulator
VAIKFHPEEDVANTGLKIKIARLRRGIKQWELAKRIGVCQNTLSFIEVGRKRPTPEPLEKITDPLNRN